MPVASTKDWSKSMTPSAKQHMKIGLQATAQCVRAGGREDVWGYLRGAHNDGFDVCRQYKAPDLSQITEDTLYEAFACAACGQPMTDHVDLSAQSTLQGRVQSKQAAQAPPPLQPPRTVDMTAVTPSAHPVGSDPNHDPFMLCDDNDPLALNARPKPKPPPPPPPPPVAPAPPAAQALGEGLSETDAFKLEVERMVREANAREKKAAEPLHARAEVDEEEVALMRQLEAVRARKAAARAAGQ
jgi:hypothetical protein